MKDIPTSTFQPANRLSSISEYFFSLANKKIQAVADKGISVINLGIGSPDLPPAPAVVQKLAQLVTEPTHYRYPSYTGLPALVSELTEWYSREYNLTVSTEQVLPIAGSKEGIFFITLALVNPGDEVLIPNPGYPTYQQAVKLVGGIVKEYPLQLENSFLPDLEALEKTDLSKVRLMWINYPNNPTGAVATIDDYQKILSFARKHHIVLASDNPYSHVTFDSFVAPSLLQVAAADDLVIELDSMSKTFNMAGVRLAWAVGNPSLIAALKVVYSNIETGIFTAVQEAGVTALQTDATWIKQRNSVYEARRDLALQLCEQLGCTARTPQASLYVWAALPKMSSSAQDYCFDLLEKTGVFITPGTAFGSNGEGFVRISLCQPEAVFMEAIKRVAQK